MISLSLRRCIRLNILFNTTYKDSYITFLYLKKDFNSNMDIFTMTLNTVCCFSVHRLYTIEKGHLYSLRLDTRRNMVWVNCHIPYSVNDLNLNGFEMICEKRRIQNDFGKNDPLVRFLFLA